MTLKQILVALPLSSLLLVACQPQGSGISNKSSLTTDDEKISYSIGQDMGNTLKQIGVPLDPSLVMRGISDIMKGDTVGLITKAERDSAMKILMTRIREARAQKDSAQQNENLKKAEDFLAKNKNEKGVITTASGLQYMIVQEGTSEEKPTTADQVEAHYVGSLLDGTEFDNSVKRGKPITFPLTGVIPGWQELLPLMKKGSKVKTWVHPKLGYGTRNMGRIPPNSLLIFEIELLDIKKGAAPAKPVAQAAKPAAVKK